MSSFYMPLNRVSVMTIRHRYNDMVTVEDCNRHLEAILQTYQTQKIPLPQDPSGVFCLINPMPDPSHNNE